MGNVKYYASIWLGTVCIYIQLETSVIFYRFYVYFFSCRAPLFVTMLSRIFMIIINISLLLLLLLLLLFLLFCFSKLVNHLPVVYF